MSPSEKSIYTRICIHHTDEERATIKCPVCLAAENAALLELHTMQLAAVSTATVQNTETTIKDRIGPDNPYYTTAYGDTCRAVDREMRLLAELAALRADKERLDWLDAVTPHIFWSAVCNHPMNPEGECAVALGTNEVFYAKTYRAAIDAALANNADQRRSPE